MPRVRAVAGKRGEPVRIEQFTAPQETAREAEEKHQLSDEVVGGKLRAERNTLLEATDWKAIRALEALYLADTPLGIYRKALRDLPAAADFPDTPMPTR